MAIMVYALDGGGPKDSENTFNSFLTKRDNDVFWQIGADMLMTHRLQHSIFPDTVYHTVLCYLFVK